MPRRAVAPRDAERPLRESLLARMRKHRDQYASLSEQSHIVTAANGVVFLSGEHVVLDGAPAVCLRLPHRVYIGLEFLQWPLKAPTGEPVVQVSTIAEDHQAYDPESDSFESLPWFVEDAEQALVPKLAPKLNEVAARFGLTRRCKIRTLHELRPAVGCNWSGALSGAATLALWAAAQAQHNLANRQEFDGAVADLQQTVGAWRNKDSAHLFRDEAFVRVVRAAWQLETVFHKGTASGYGPVGALLPASHPFFYCTARRTLDGEWPRDPRRPDAPWPRDVTGKEGALEELPIAGQRLELDEGEHATPDADLPEIACCVVYTGRRHDTGEAIKEATQQLQDRLEGGLRAAQTTVLSRTVFTQTGRDGSPPVAPVDLVSSQLSGLNSGDMRRRVVEAAAITGLPVVHAIAGLYGATAGTRQAVGDLAAAVRGIQGALTALGVDRPEMYPVMAAAYDAARLNREGLGPDLTDRTGVKITGGGAGGSMVVVLPKNDDALARLVSNVSDLPRARDGRPYVDWVSAWDGLAEPGPLLESGHISPNCLVIGIPATERIDQAYWKQHEASYGPTDRTRLQEATSTPLIRVESSWERGFHCHLFINGHRVDQGPPNNTPLPALGALSLAVAACAQLRGTTFGAVLTVLQDAGDPGARGLDIYSFNSQCRNPINSALRAISFELRTERNNGVYVEHSRIKPADAAHEDYYIYLAPLDDEAAASMCIDNASSLFAHLPSDVRE